MKNYLLFVSALVFWFAFPQQGKGQSDQTVTNGEATAPIIFQGTACQYGWYVGGPFSSSGPFIGLTAFGSGNISSFTAINTGNKPVTATITAMPELSQYAYVTDSASNEVSVVDTYNEGEIVTIPVLKPAGVSVNPAGTVAYITGAAGISVISTASSSVTATIGLRWQTYGLVVSPDGSRLYVVGNDSLAVINTVSNTKITSLKAGSGAHGVAISPDGSRVYVSNQKDNTVSVIATATNTVLATVPAGANPDGLAVSPDGSLVYVVNHATNRVSVIHTSTYLLTATIIVGTSPAAVVFAPSGALAYVSNTGSNTVSVVNTTTNLVIATIGVQSGPTGISINPDGSLVYVANKGSNSVSVISTTTNAIVTNVPVGTAPIAFGNFVSKGTGCSGTIITIHITVNPTPAGQPVINIGPETGSIAACAGNASVSPRLQQFAVTGTSLSGAITATAPAGFELSLTPVSGYTGSLVIGQTAGAANGVVYVRSAAADPPGALSGNVLLTTAGASAVEVPVTGTVNALPVVDPVASQIVNNGATTAAINFTGTGNVYTWVNDTPSIGLAAGGTGNIAAFTAVNKGVVPVTATITVTPEPGAFAYVGDSNGNVSVINTTTNNVVTVIPVGNSLFGASVSPDASTVYVSSSHSKFATWNTIAGISTATNTVTSTINANYGPFTVVNSHDGSRLFFTTTEGADFEVINTITQNIVSRLFFGERPIGFAVTNDERKAYVGNFDSDTVWVVDIAANSIVKKILVGSKPETLQVSSDGAKLFVANTVSGTISVINTTTDEVIATIPVGGSEPVPDGYPWGLTFSPDGSRLYVANSILNAVQVINTQTYKIMATIPVGAIPTGTSITPDGSKLFVVNYNDGTVSVINTVSDKVIATVKVGLNPFSIGNFISPGTGCTGKPVKFTITVNPDPVLVPTIAAGPVTGSMPTCFGIASVDPNIQQFTVGGVKLTGNITVMAPDDFEVSLSPTNGFGSSVTLSPTAGIVNQITVYVRLAATAPIGTISGVVTLSSAGAANVTVLANGDVEMPASPSVSISAPATTVCAGTPVTFTANPVNGGSSPVYQWQINGNNAGVNSATFTSSTLANGDIVACLMTSDVACATPASVNSNTITMTVNPLLSPSVSITASAAAVCAGTPVTFTATPVNGGPAPTYQWQVNGSSAGSNNAEFTSGSLADGDVITCIMTGNEACGVPVQVASNSLTENVYPLPTVAAGGNKTISEGSSTVLNATDTGEIADVTWSPPTGLSNSKMLNPVASPTTTTTYTVTITTTTGCTAADSTIIKVVIPPIVIPNTFTPNGDGINDTWDVKYLSYYPDCMVQIFTRWGEKIYASTGYPTPWNGDYHNTPLPIGTYYYIINLENGSPPLSGFVAIIR